MPQTKIGAIKIVAAKAGCTVDEFVSRVALGEKWCYACNSWLAVSAFNGDVSRYDGLDSRCRDCRKAAHKKNYVRRPRTSKLGSRFAEIRDGDKLQARARVNHMVNIGLLPKPMDLPCSNCGHSGNDRRHEYHHFRGYGTDHQESVKALCAKCHRKSEPVKIIRQRNGKGQYHGR